MYISKLNNIIFHLSYVYYKVSILNDVKSPKFKLFFFESLYSLNKITKFPIKIHSLFNIDYVETKFGKFFIRPKTEYIICASPAFERNDLNYLISLLSYTQKKKKILFLDIGADFGSYSVSLGNSFKKYKNLDIFSFEPILVSYKFLRKNIKINNLDKKVKTYNIALTEKTNSFFIYYDSNRSGSSSMKGKKGEKIKIVGRTLDSLKINA